MTTYHGKLISWDWELHPEACIGCGVCADVCADEAIAMTRDQAQPTPVVGACVGCYECVRQCPTDAIEVRTVDPTKGNAP